MESSEETSLLEKLDAAVPNHLTRFDAFPKLPSTYKQRSGSRGLLTLLLGFVTFLLVLNDIGEYIWGWPDYEFSVDNAKDSYMSVNVDLVVNMPCQCELIGSSVCGLDADFCFCVSFECGSEGRSW